MPSQTTTLRVIVLLAALETQRVFAAEAIPPNAGSILQQIQPLPPRATPSNEAGLTIEQQAAAKAPPGVPFLVTAIQITGNKKVATATLHALVADAEGQTLTLEQLNNVAARITAYYHRHGYALARALIPAQVIENGIVRIQVVVADFGQVSLDSQSKVNSALLAATLAPLRSGAVISEADLNHALLLLSDIPGVAVTAVLRPGDAVGTSDLAVSAHRGPDVSGNVVLDDYGNRYTGRVRAGGTVNVINPLNHGDVLTLGGMSSGAGMNYGRLAYDTLLNGLGTRAGGSWSAMRYILGEPLVALGAHGTAQVQSLWARHPLVRSRAFNLYTQVQYDGMQLSDHMDVLAIRSDRTLQGGTLSLSGDARDAYLTGGIYIWNLGWTTGRVAIDDPAARSLDAATTRTRGSYSKWNASLAHLHYLGPRDGLYLAASGQWASGNLDTSQKMIVGGPYTVRAYDTGALTGDTGYLLTAEYRHTLGSLLRGKWMSVAFLDSAHVTINKNTWVPGENSATLSGAGLGLKWSGSHQWDARAYVATPIGHTPSVMERARSAQLWMEVSRWF